MLYLDTNVFIYLVEGPPERVDPLKELFRELHNRRGFAVTSELTLAEILAPASAPGALSLAAKLPLYRSLIVLNPAITLLPVSRDVLFGTAELRMTTRHKLPDAIHVVTAIQSQCRFFMSNDGDAKKLPPGVTRLHPDATGVATILAELHA
jgi:predicted nucleic acid-binding protein